MLAPINVGQEGSLYLQRKLAGYKDWSPSLPVVNALSKAQTVSSGSSYAFVEAELGCNLYNFDSWQGNGYKSAMELVVTWIWAFIHRNPAYVCLIDEVLNKTSDPSWQNDVYPSAASMVKYSESSIFYCISSQTASREQIAQLILATFWFPFHCAFVSDDEKIFEALPLGQEISGECLLKIARQTCGVVTDAYDLEGLLVWARKQPSSLDNPFLNQNG